MFLYIFSSLKMFDRNVISYCLDCFLCVILAPLGQIIRRIINEKFRILDVVDKVR